MPIDDSMSIKVMGKIIELISYKYDGIILKNVCIDPN